MILDLMPAYGRTYPQLNHALAAWQAGADFRIHQGPYCSIRDRDLLQKQGLRTARFWSGAKRLGEVEIADYAPTTAPAPALASL